MQHAVPLLSEQVRVGSSDSPREDAAKISCDARPKDGTGERQLPQCNCNPLQFMDLRPVPKACVEHPYYDPRTPLSGSSGPLAPASYLLNVHRTGWGPRGDSGPARGRVRA